VKKAVHASYAERAPPKRSIKGRLRKGGGDGGQIERGGIFWKSRLRKASSLPTKRERGTHFPQKTRSCRVHRLRRVLWSKGKIRGGSSQKPGKSSLDNFLSKKSSIKEKRVWKKREAQGGRKFDRPGRKRKTRT